MEYWLLKSEPDTFSIEQLKRDGVTPWEGVRNFGARNSMRAMRVGDRCLFYHSSCAVPAVVGVARVVAGAHPDQTQFDSKSMYFEKRATVEKPVWYCVDVRFEKKFTKPITLAQIKADPAFEGMLVREKRGMRLSVQPVSKRHYDLCVEKG